MRWSKDNVAAVFELSNILSRAHHSIFWAIWSGFCSRVRTIQAPTFEHTLQECKTLTDLAIARGARIEECVHLNQRAGNLIHLLANHFSSTRAHFTPKERRDVFTYLQYIGCSMELCNGLGLTPLLAVTDCHEHTDGPHKVGPLIGELISMGADLTALTASGEGPLDVALNRLKVWHPRNNNEYTDHFKNRLLVLLQAGSYLVASRKALCVAEYKFEAVGKYSVICDICKSTLLDHGWSSMSIDIFFAGEAVLATTNGQLGLRVV
jgi:hypothetical protein